MTEERSQRSRERRYAVLPKETVQVYAESVGLSELTEDVSSQLAEDVSYRLRDIIQQSYEYMRHAKRRKLTVDDMNLAMKHSDIQPIFGYGFNEGGVTFQQTAERELFFAEDKEIDLVSFALSEDHPPRIGPTTVKVGWLAIEGVQTALNTPLPPSQVTSQGKTGGGRTVQNLSEDLLIYYDLVTKAILGTDSTVMKHALADLTTNSKVAPLLAYFVNFVSNGVKTVSHDTSQLSRLLYTVKALITNRALFLQPKPYLTLLTQTVLYCQLEPLAASINPISDHWILRDYAAILLAQTMSRWDTPTNKLLLQNKKLLGDILLDTGRPLCSHYGAIVGLLALGLDAVKSTLVPILSNCFEYLSVYLIETSSVSSTHHSDAHHVRGALLLCADYLIRFERRQLLAHSTDEHLIVESDTAAHQPSHIYSIFYDYLGDSLSLRLPINRCHFRDLSVTTVTHLRETNVLGEDVSSRQTGEQLLQQFLDPPARDFRSERSSERSSPMSSDFGGVAGGDADMAIKETVSDPSRGIRLTILKRPKVRPADEMPVAKQFLDGELTASGQTSSVEPGDSASSNTDANRRSELHSSEMPKLTMARSSLFQGAKVKVSLTDAFEDMAIKSKFPKRRESTSSVVFVFKFQGRVQECVAPTGPKVLHRWGISPGRPALSWYQVLCRRWKFVGKQPRVKSLAGSAFNRRSLFDDSQGQSNGRRDAHLTCALDLANTVL